MPRGIYPRKKIDPVERFKAKLGATQDNGCIPWMGARNKHQYGIFRLDGCKSTFAHRVSFYFAYGYWPDVVYHSCDNPPCCNPEHLMGGTQADNIKDMDSKGRRVPAEGALNGRVKHPEAYAHLVGENAWAVKNRDLLPRGKNHWSNRMPERRVMGERNGRATITDSIAIEIRTLYKTGEWSQHKLAHRFSITRGAVANLVQEKTWRHLL